jgi:hypothetical protein
MNDSLQDFVSSFQTQVYFDPDEGSILNIVYSQNFTRQGENSDLLLATKYAYFRAFLVIEVFALDGHSFLPKAWDEIVLLTTCWGHMKDVTAEVVDFDTFTDEWDSSNVFVRITATGEQFP